MEIIGQDWLDYECIDAGNGEKLERWGDVILRRPDPTAIWPANKETKLWKSVHAHYHRSNKGGGMWQKHQPFSDEWTINYKELTFKVAPTNFKHTGLFPEQAVNWDWMSDLIKSANRPIKVLNLFAYTGGATMACAAAGAGEVVHVDAAKGMTLWAKENMNLSKLQDRKIRFIVDDVMKFVQREQRRGNQYDAIIMDPPSYGRGPGGEIWKLEEQIYPLIQNCVAILSDQPLFLLVNSYTTGFGSLALENVLKQTVLKKYKNGTIQTGSIGLPISHSNLVLPCGIYGRFYL